MSAIRLSLRLLRLTIKAESTSPAGMRLLRLTARLSSRMQTMSPNPAPQGATVQENAAALKSTINSIPI